VQRAEPFPAQKLELAEHQINVYLETFLAGESESPADSRAVGHVPCARCLELLLHALLAAQQVEASR